MLGHGGKREVVRGCDVRQDKRRVGNIGMVGDCSVDGLEGMVCGFLSVVSAEVRPKMTSLSAFGYGFGRIVSFRTFFLLFISVTHSFVCLFSVTCA